MKAKIREIHPRVHVHPSVLQKSKMKLLSKEASHIFYIYFFLYIFFFFLGEGQAKELLQLFDIRGTCVTRIFASEDFKKFVTVDDAGIVYILQEVDNVITLQNSTIVQKPTSL